MAKSKGTILFAMQRLYEFYLTCYYLQTPNIMKYALLLLLYFQFHFAFAQFDYLQHLNMHGSNKPIVITSQLPNSNGVFHTMSTHYWVYSATGAPVRHVLMEGNDTSRITFYQYNQQQLVVQLVTNARRDTFAYTQFLYRNGLVDTAILYERTEANNVFTPLVLKKKTAFTRNNKGMITGINEYVLHNNTSVLQLSKVTTFDFVNDTLKSIHMQNLDTRWGNVISTQTFDQLKWHKYQALANVFYPNSNQLAAGRNTHIELDTSIYIDEFEYNELGHEILKNSTWYMDGNWSTRTPISTEYSYSPNGEILELTKFYLHNNAAIPFFRQQFEGYLHTFLSHKANLNYSIQIYPNPASDVVTIQLPFEQELAVACIYDMKGKLVANYALSQTENVIPIHELTNGIFLIKIDHPGGSAIKPCKLIVQRQ